jgi:hypothetical protein
MNNKSIQILMSIVFISCAQTLLSVPTKIILKNASAFDFVYKPLDAADDLYKYGQTTPHGYEENLINAGEAKIVNVGVRRPLRLSIKRYGYGSSMSAWFDVPNPEDLAQEQLTPDQFAQYQNAINKGVLPIIRISSSFLGGWRFSIGYIK